MQKVIGVLTAVLLLFSSSFSFKEDSIDWSGFNYTVEFKIGQGSFGDVFEVRDPKTKAHFVCKLERNGSRSFKREEYAYSHLKNQIGFATRHWYGLIDGRHALVLDLLGENLAMLHNECNNAFSTRTTAMLAIAMISRLHTLHNATHLVHRDVKPENFVIGRGNNSHELYLIDFGESKPFTLKGTTTNEHIPYRVSDAYCGTRKFMSPNSHLGIDLTRRDDLISLGYSLIYLLKGTLPWMIFPQINTGSEKNSPILAMKKSTNLTELVGDAPEPFLRYLEYVFKLEFSEIPDYEYLKSLFTTLVVSFDSAEPYDTYDWEENAIKSQKSSIFS